jgi:hypothetical protein
MRKILVKENFEYFKFFLTLISHKKNNFSVLG